MVPLDHEHLRERLKPGNGAGPDPEGTAGASRDRPAKTREGSGAGPTGPPGPKSRGRRVPEGLRALALCHGGRPGVAGGVPGAAHPARGTRRGEADPLWGRGQVRHQDGLSPPPCEFSSLLSPGPAGMPSRGVRGRSQCEGGCARHRAGLRGKRKSRACGAAGR